MAIVTRGLFTCDDQKGTFNYQYDDASTPANLITAVITTNTTGTGFQVIFKDGSTGTVLLTTKVVDPNGVNDPIHNPLPANPPNSFNPGTQDISVLGLHMVQKTVFGRTQLVLPVQVFCSWPA